MYKMEIKTIFRKILVGKLSQLAAKEFVETLGSGLEYIAVDIDNEAEAAEALEEINKYLIESGTTTPVYHKLLRLTVSCASPHYNALAVELLFNQTFKHFYAIDCGDKNSRMAMAIATKATALSVLESLDLSDFSLDESDWYIFELILKNYPNLKDIKLPRKPDFGYWLPLLSDHCIKLRHLTVQNLHNLSEIANASFKTTLQKISIHEEEDSELLEEDCLRELTPLFNTCPNLCLVVPNDYLSSVIEKCIATNANFNCNLESLNIWKPNQSLQQITKACPKLIDLTLTARTDCTLAVLSPLQLKSLDILDFDIQELLQLAENWSNCLKSLSLRSNHEGTMNFVDVYEVLNKYQNLTKLKIEFCTARYDKKIEYPHVLAKFYMMCCDFPKYELLNMLSGLQNLQEFFAYEVSFTDEDMDKVFGGNSFLHFKTFFVEIASNLTIRSVHILLESCPKLKYVGPLLEWNIRKSDLKSISCLTRKDHYIYLELWSKLYIGEELFPLN